MPFRGERRATPIRLAAAAGASGFVVLSHQLHSSEVEIAQLQYEVVVSLGYAHLLAAWWPSADRSRGRVAMFARLNRVPVAFAVLALALHAVPGLAWLLLGAAIWHTAENDSSLVRFLNASPRRAPLSLAPRDLLRVAWIAVAIALVSLGADWGSVPEPTRPRWLLRLAVLSTALGALGWWITGRARQVGCGLSAGVLSLCSISRPLPFAFSDIFALTTLYHLLQWLGLACHQLAGASAQSLARRVHRLAVSHVGAIGICAFIIASAGNDSALYAVTFSPGLYLCWSTLHVVQTSWVRGHG